MKNEYLSFAFLLFLVLFISGCNSTEPGDSSEFESGYYYTTTIGKISLFRSRLIVAVEFESSVSAEMAKDIIHTYNLEPIKMFENTPYGNEWEDLISDDVVLMRLPKGAKLEDYLTAYPRTTNQKFGNLQSIKFSLPVFAFNSDGDPRSRFIINDEILISSKVDSATTINIVSNYNLTFINKNPFVEVQYKFALSDNSPANSLSISNLLYSHSEINWAMPNGYAYISH